MSQGFNAISRFGLFTMLSLPIYYVLHCNKGWSGGNTTLRNRVGDGGGEWGAHTGALANNTIDSSTKASNKTIIL